MLGEKLEEVEDSFKGWLIVFYFAWVKGEEV